MTDPAGDDPITNAREVWELRTANPASEIHAMMEQRLGTAWGEDEWGLYQDLLNWFLGAYRASADRKKEDRP